MERVQSNKSFTNLCSTVDLQLLGKDDPNCPLFVIPLRNHLLFFGGESGNLTTIPLSSAMIQAGTTPNGDHDTPSKFNSSSSANIIHRFDEPIRALAISSDELRIALGFEDGTTTIYSYEPSEVMAKDHPFLGLSDNKNSDDKNGEVEKEREDSDSLDDGLFTQSSNLELSQTSVSDIGTSFHASRGDASVRGLAFRSNSPYYLAVATESSSGFSIIDATTATTITDPSKRYLEEEAKTAHDHGGVRALACNRDTIATIGMDGRLCLWNVKDEEDPSLNWELLHRDDHKVIKKVDIGELNGADVGDRCSFPTWHLHKNNVILGIPGERDLQIRLKANYESSKLDWAEKDLMIMNKDGFGHSKEIVAIAFDPEGKFVATGGRDCTICLWEIYDIPEENKKDDAPIGRFISQLATLDCICSHLIWLKIPGDDKYSKPKDVMCVTLENGSMQILSGRKNIVPLNFVEKAKTANILPKESKEEGVITKKILGNKVHSNLNTMKTVDTDVRDVISDEEDFDTQPSIDATIEIPTKISSAGKMKRLTKMKDSHQDSDDDDDLDFSNPQTHEAVDNITKNNFVSDEAEDDEENTKFDDQIENTETNDEEALETQDIDVEDVLNKNEDEFLNNDEHRSEVGDLLATNVTRPQDPIAPSATPLGEQCRILCWNHVGVITLRDEGAVNTIYISFLDAAFRKPINFTDNLRFIFGSLGEDGAIFASDGIEEEEDIDDDTLRGLSEATKAVVKRSQRKKRKNENDFGLTTGSTIYFHRFETFGNPKDKDWHITLPDGEMVLGCACGQGWSAVVTDRCFLRIFTSGGMQGPVVWLNGNPVTIVGRGRFLAVLYHDADPLADGTQKLGYILYDAIACCEISSGSVSALSSGSLLTWAGFSNDFSLSIMDSEGFLSLLFPLGHDSARIPSNWGWIPMLDTTKRKKSPNDTFWPIHIQDGKLNCIPLKGDTQYPNAARRPITSSLNLRIPLAHALTENRTTMEEVSIRANIALRQNKVVNNFAIMNGEEDAEEVESEYSAMCARVDKVTLKLFIPIAEAGNVERAFDLTQRLHLEKSFDIALTVSDRLNLRKLSDRILILKENRFNVLDDDSDDDSDDDINHSERKNPSFRSTDRNDLFDSREVTPGISPLRVKRENNKDVEARNVRAKVSISDEEQHCESIPKNSRRINPFAKKRLESPARPTPTKRLDKEPKLSRSSTFSAQSRKQSKISKQII